MKITYCSDTQDASIFFSKPIPLTRRTKINYPAKENVDPTSTCDSSGSQIDQSSADLRRELNKMLNSFKELPVLSGEDVQEFFDSLEAEMSSTSTSEAPTEETVEAAIPSTSSTSTCEYPEEQIVETKQETPTKPPAKPKKVKSTVFTAAQIECLHSIRDEHPDGMTNRGYQVISEQFGVTISQVKNWFYKQNTKSKKRMLAKLNEEVEEVPAKKPAQNPSVKPISL